MDKCISSDICAKINNIKMQLIINKNLYNENVVNKELYELTELSLLEKLDKLSSGLETVN